jgi:hypothetical protein
MVGRSNTDAEGRHCKQNPVFGEEGRSRMHIVPQGVKTFFIGSNKKANIKTWNKRSV